MRESEENLTILYACRMYAVVHIHSATCPHNDRLYAVFHIYSEHIPSHWHIYLIYRTS